MTATRELQAVVEFCDHVGSFDPQALEVACKATSTDEGGASIVEEAMNLFAALWDGSLKAEDDDFAFLARTVADAGMRLRREAIALQMVEERGPGFYVAAGKALFDATNAVYACSQFVAARAELAPAAP